MAEHLVRKIKKYFLKPQQKGELFFEKNVVSANTIRNKLTQSILLVYENVIVWVVTIAIAYTGWCRSLGQQVRGGALHGCGDGHSGSRHKWSRRGCSANKGCRGCWADGRTWCLNVHCSMLLQSYSFWKCENVSVLLCYFFIRCRTALPRSVRCKVWLGLRFGRFGFHAITPMSNNGVRYFCRLS